MDEQKLINVAVAQQPTLSSVAVSPKPLSNAMLGAVTSLFLALCAVYLAESGLPLLANSMPRPLIPCSLPYLEFPCGTVASWSDLWAAG